MCFSRKTLAAIAEALAEISHSELNGLFYGYELNEAQVGGNRRDKALAFIRAIEANKKEDEAQQILIEVMERFVSRRLTPRPDLDDIPDDIPPNETLERLRAALSLDGLEFRSGQLLPTTPPPAALGPEISVLESDLAALGMSTASKHYRQATDNCTDRNWEACNSQIRPFLEDLYIRACELSCSQTYKEPRGALDHMRDKSFIDTEEWNILRYIWKGFQDNGPHRGLSSDQEALFRLHLATAIGRYLAHKLRAGGRDRT